MIIDEWPCCALLQRDGAVFPAPPIFLEKKLTMRARLLALPLLNLALILALLGVSVGARAETASSWARNDHAAVRLVAADVGDSADGALALGLQFRLKPGWHIYWRAPGDAGVPPSVDWSGSENFTAPAIRWPLPARYTIFGLTTFVYGDEVVLPIAARAPAPGKPVRLRAKVAYLACEKICIPYDASLSLDLGPGAGTDAGGRALIARYAARVPVVVSGDKAEAPIRVKRARLLRGDDGFALEVLASGAAPLAAPDILVEGPRELRFGLPRHELSADGRSVLFRLPVTIAGPGVPEAPRLTVTLADRSSAAPVAVEQSVIADTHAAGADGIGLAAILAIALLGGLTLNLMPCVLPVLSLKLMSVLGHGGERAMVRRGFLATAAGIVFSFMVLAGGALALKATGTAVGWGVQFQSPLFLGAMTAVVTLFAANLFGLFDIAVPGFAGRLAGAAPADNKGNLSGAFATGAFATLLATPCSAPFLGTAIGFALTRGWAEILAVFAALGIGLAAPYLAVAAFPRLAAALPRPGRWMVGLRFVLGIALAATALWLVFVIKAVAGPVAAIAAVVAVALLFVLLVLGRGGRFGRGALRGGLVALVLAAAVAPSFLARDGDAGNPVAGDIAWRPFDKVALYNLVAEGRTVLIDVTAEWCVTCKANKALVTERGAVARALATGRVIAMRADWTRPDPSISAYLAGFGRFGIPFNAVYGPARPTGIALPELLTETAVLDAFAVAAGPAGDK